MAGLTQWLTLNALSLAKEPVHGGTASRATFRASGNWDSLESPKMLPFSRTSRGTDYLHPKCPTLFSAL